MILEIFAAVNAIGFLAWILGSVFQMRAVAAVGGVVIVGAGVMVIGTGLEYRSGQVRDHTYNNSNYSENPLETTVTYQYTEAPMPEQYSLGFLIVLLGSIGLFRALEPES